MSAWVDESQNTISDVDRKFEDNFVSETAKGFQPLEDSQSYLKLLGKYFGNDKRWKKEKLFND
jgi:hypothetical protein